MGAGEAQVTLSLHTENLARRSPAGSPLGVDGKVDAQAVPQLARHTGQWVRRDFL